MSLPPGFRKHHTRQSRKNLRQRMKWSEVVHCPYNMTITRSAPDYTFQQPFIEAGGIVTKLHPS